MNDTLTPGARIFVPAHERSIIAGQPPQQIPLRTGELRELGADFGTVDFDDSDPWGYMIPVELIRADHFSLHSVDCDYHAGVGRCSKDCHARRAEVEAGVAAKAAERKAANMNYDARRLVTQLDAHLERQTDLERDDDTAGGDWNTFWTLYEVFADNRRRSFFVAVNQQDGGPVSLTIRVDDEEGEPADDCTLVVMTDPRATTALLYVEAALSSFRIRGAF